MTPTTLGRAATTVPAEAPPTFPLEVPPGVRLIVGCRLDLIDGTGILVYPLDRGGYGRLCRLLSMGKTRGGKGACKLDWPDLAHFGEGLAAALVTIEADDLCALRLKRLKQTYGDNAYLALSRRYRPGDAKRLHDLSNLAVAAGVPTIVTNNVLFHEPSSTACLLPAASV